MDKILKSSLRRKIGKRLTGEVEVFKLASASQEYIEDVRGNKVLPWAGDVFFVDLLRDANWAHDCLYLTTVDGGITWEEVAHNLPPRDGLIRGKLCFVKELEEQEAIENYKEAVHVVYRNYKGITAVRSILPFEIYFDSNEYHEKDQWLLDCWDYDKRARRTYAMKDVISWDVKIGD